MSYFFKKNIDFVSFKKSAAGRKAILLQDM